MIELSKYGLETDELLTSYVGRLTIDSLYTVNNIKFILSSYPLVDSKVFRLIKLDQTLYDSAFYSFPFQERVRINRNIFTNSSAKAIQEKDRAYMQKVSNFLRDSYDDKNAGYKA